VTQPTTLNRCPNSWGHYNHYSFDALNISELWIGSIPVKLAFPDGSSASVKSCKDVAVKVVTWFGSKGRLPQLPFRGLGRGQRWFL